MRRPSTACTFTLALLAVLFSTDALACRCAQRALADYYAEADVVVAARVSATRMSGQQLQLVVTPLAPPYKGELSASSRFVTATNSAACGLDAAPGAQLLLFGQRDPAVAGDFNVHTCNGSRHFAADAESDFVDVPSRFVESQLMALQGLALLQQIGRHDAMRNQSDNTKLVGLLEMPSLDNGESAVLYDRLEAPHIELAVIKNTNALEHREASYEAPAAVVYAAHAGGYRVKQVGGGFGWVKANVGGDFWPYADLLPRRLAYLNSDWDGYLWPDLGAGLPFRGPPARDGRVEIPIEVHEAKQIAGSLWFRIDVLDNNGCEGDASKVVASGWVPAYGSNGEPAAWYYSRGC